MRTYRKIYDTPHIPSPHYQGREREPYAPTTSSPSSRSSISQSFRGWTLPTEKDHRNLWSRFRDANPTKKSKNRHINPDNKSSGRRLYEYLATRITEFIEDYKAEPIDKSIWELYKDYRKEKKLFKRWKEFHEHEEKKRQISRPTPVTQAWNGGADPFKDYTNPRPEPPKPFDEDRETSFRDFMSMSSKQSVLKRAGLETGNRVSDASFICIGVDSHGTGPTLPSLPTLQRRVSISPSNYSAPESCHMSAQGGYCWGVCHGCAAAAPSPRKSSGCRSSFESATSADTISSLEELTRGYSAYWDPQVEEVPVLYTPTRDSLTFTQPKIYNPDERRQHTREERSPNRIGDAAFQAPTSVRTREGLPKTPYVFRYEIATTGGMPEGEPF